MDASPLDGTRNSIQNPDTEHENYKTNEVDQKIGIITEESKSRVERPEKTKTIKELIAELE